MSWFKKFIAIGSLLIICAGLALVIIVSIFDSQLWWWIVIPLIVLYFINIIFAVYVFYSKRRNSVEKKCWMMILIVLPILGVIAYIKYGLNPFHKTNFNNYINCRKRLNKIDGKNKHNQKSNKDTFNFLSNYCKKLVHTSPTKGNVQILENIEDLYKLTIDSIRSAEKVIFINFYIIADGIWLRSIVNELKKKAQQGVRIYFLFDWGGSKKRYPNKLVKNLEDAGINVNIFRPKRFFYVSGYDNSRSHKKIIIIDNKICLYGGFNLSDEYINYSKDYEYWTDDAFIIKGDIIKENIKSFICDWVIYGDTNKCNQDIFNDIKKFNLFKENGKNNNCLIQLFDSNPEFQEYQMINLLTMCFARAKKRIWINTPYLYPTEYLINVFVSLAKAGIDIRIIVPGLPDNKEFILAINRSQYSTLINAGIKIYEINSFHHSKGIIIDDNISLIGTCNLDPRAMNLNYENISIINSKKLNQQLSNKFLSNIKNSHQANVDIWKQVSLKNKILVKLLMLWEPLF